jgi:hypothetical protein
MLYLISSYVNFNILRAGHDLVGRESRRVHFCSRSDGENGGDKGRCVGGRERGKRRREKERGGRFPD